MSPSIRKIAAFTTGCIVTVVVWSTLSPTPEKPSVGLPQPQHEAVKKQLWPVGKTASLVAALNQADSDEAKVRAANHLLSIPTAEIDDAFSEIEWKDGNRLSLAAKVLLIRMASEDGKATAERAWKHLHSQKLWPQAFAQIGPAWAAHDPASLVAWATSFAGKTKSVGGEGTERKPDRRDGPTLDHRGLTDVIGWLVTEDPEAAYQLLRKRGGFSSDDQLLPLVLFSTAKVNEALMAFGDLRITDPNRVEGDQVQLFFLLHRWQEIDPESFDASPYALSFSAMSSSTPLPSIVNWMKLPAEQRAAEATRIVSGALPAGRINYIQGIAKEWSETDPGACAKWLDTLPLEYLDSVNKTRALILAPHDLNGTLDHIDNLPPEPQNWGLVTAFDSWTKAHPGQRADRTGWSAGRISAWEDLEALLPVDGP